MSDFRTVGSELSNAGRWGADDRIGTLNHITPARRAAAAALVLTGRVFDLAIDIGRPGIQRAGGVRSNPVHLMRLTPLDRIDPLHNTCIADDHISMPLQSVTQWDGLGHVGYDDMLYNNIPASSITTLDGSRELSIHQIVAAGVAGRGVLLDIARHCGVDRMEAGDIITPQMLEKAEQNQGVSVGAGDILLLRTGWIRHFTVDGDAEAYWRGEPGIGLDVARWLYERDVAAIACDNWAVESSPVDRSGGLPVHPVLIRDMGMTLGEIFLLEELATDCAADGVWEFLFVAPPLKVVGGVGSPITPLAIK
ncbi:cyclase family protein [Novosphingopyxis sp.]|uniref:cyclase family protein n=1 Tax=Novosphingopyxis sp. TaxID=2709690 RepID=UPI003B58CB55